MKSTHPNDPHVTDDSSVAIQSASPPRWLLRCLAMAALAGFATPVTAEDVLIAPVAVTALNSWGDRTTSDAIDGGGMTPNNPVTVASTCSTDASTMYMSNGVVQTWITFDLGSSQTLTGLRLWNYNEGGSWSGRGVKDAGIYVGTSMPADGSSYASMGPSWGTWVQNYTFTQATGASGSPGADYMFTTPVVGRYIQIYVTANFGTADTYTGISEIRFYKPYVPEANILTFGLPPEMPGTITDTSVTFYVPTSTVVTGLAPLFTLSRDATCFDGDPELGGSVITSGAIRDFTSPVHYWVRSANDGVNPVVTNDYTVTATPYSQAGSYTWVKATTPGTYDWKSANWDAPGWPDGAGTAAICNTKAGNNVWNILSPSITLGSLSLGGDVSSRHTLSGPGTLIFDNGASHASLYRGNVSTTTDGYIQVAGITLNSILDIELPYAFVSPFHITSPISGSGGLNIISAAGNFPAEGWFGLILTGALTYDGDTAFGPGAYVDMAGSLKLKVTDTGSNKITGTGTIRLSGSLDIDTSAVTVTAGSWNLIDVGTLKEYYGTSFSVTGYTKSDGLWTKTDGSKTWIFNPTTGVLALPAAWITSFTYGSAVGSIDQNARTISLTVPNGTNPATVSPTFTVYSGTCDQTSGSPPSPNFAVANPATYTVTDSSVGVTRVYTVTLTVAPPAPGGVGADLALWLDASDASTMSTSSGTVTEWRDKFGGTGKVTATGAPTLVPSGIGGIPTVHFNTSSHMNDGVNRAAGPVTIFLVARETGGSNARVLSSASNNWLMGYWGGNRDSFYFEGAVNFPGQGSDTNPRLHAATLDVSGDTYTVYANGAQVASNNGGSAGPNNLQLNGSGFGEYSDCDISEVVVYNRVLTAGELNSVGGYLAAKYSLTTSYPSLAEIVSFGVPGYDGVINQATKTIVLTVPIGTNLATLAPTFTVFSGTCTDQTSGTPPSPTFAAHNPATYTIQDGTVTNVYTVTVELYVPPYTWVKTTPAGTYDWESAHWNRDGYPNAATTVVTCNTQAGTNVWNITSPSITIGSLHLGGDVGANQTLNGAGKTLIFDNGASHASFTRGTDISTTTGAALNLGAITLNSTLDISITSHLTSLVSINAPIGGTGGLNIISASGNYPAEGWSGLNLNGANTYTGDTVLGDSAWVILNDGSSHTFKVTDSGSSKITGTGTIRLNGAINIDTSAVTLTAGKWTLIDVGTLKEYYGTTFTVTGFTKDSSTVWKKVDGAKVWYFDTSTGLLSNPAAWITDFRWGSNVGVIDQGAMTINLTVSNLTNLALLNPTFTLYSGTCDQTSGSPPSPTFAGANPVTYTVTDGEVVNAYTVTVTLITPRSDKEISNIHFAGTGFGYAYPANAAGTNWTLQVRSGTLRNPLSPTYDMSAGATSDPASGSALNFSGAPQTYRITAEDATYQDYWVFVAPYADYEARVMTSNPYGYWPMHEGRGIIAYNNTSGDRGSYNSSGVSYVVPGPAGMNAVSFSGDNVAMRVPNTAPYDPDTAFSVELWVKPGSASTSGCLASNFTASAAEGRSGWLIYQNSTTAGKYSARLYNHNGTNFSCDLQADILDPGQTDPGWTHLALTWDDTTGTARFYKNGVLAATSATGITYFGSKSGDPMAVGMRSDSNYEWTGAACSFAFYTRTLTAEEVLLHITVTPYTAWAAMNYPGADLSDPAADPDRDGQTNQQEFAFGLDPTKGSSCNPITELLDQASHTFSYTRYAASGLTYTVWTSTNLLVWNQVLPAYMIENASAPNSAGVATVDVTLTNPPSGNKLFVRVQAE